MPERIPEDKIRLIGEMYGQGIKTGEISRRVGIEYSTVYFYTRGKERGFASRGKYANYQAKKRGFASHRQYLNYLARQKGFPSAKTYERFMSYRKERDMEGMLRVYDYMDSLKNGLNLPGNLNAPKPKKYVPSEEEKQELERKRVAACAALSDLLRRGLNEMGINQKQFSEKSGINAGEISRYINGLRIPTAELQPRLFSALGVPYKTIDDIVKDINN